MLGCPRFPRRGHPHQRRAYHPYGAPYLGSPGGRGGVRAFPIRTPISPPRQPKGKKSSKRVLFCVCISPTFSEIEKSPRICANLNPKKRDSGNWGGSWGKCAPIATMLFKPGFRLKILAQNLGQKTLKTRPKKLKQISTQRAQGNAGKLLYVCKCDKNPDWSSKWYDRVSPA